MAAKKKARAESAEDRTRAMNAYMAHLKHPLKAEIGAVRMIIKQASGKIAERVKWDVPTFYYKEDFATFSLEATKHVHLMLHFPEGTTIPEGTGMPEGEEAGRRDIRFRGMSDIAAAKPALAKLVRDWVAEMERRSSDRGKE